MKVNFKLLKEGATSPSYATEYAAGADLYNLRDEEVTLGPGETKLIHTGIALESPEGYVGLIFARSGLATKRGLAPANKVGVIDSDYRGEIFVALMNNDDKPQTIENGERIGQLMILPVIAAAYTVADELDETARGAGGFGSTGTK